MANSGIKIAPQNTDIRTAADKDMVLTSKHKTFKAVMTGIEVFSFSSGGGDITRDITHTLGYNPGFLVFFLESLDNVVYVNAINSPDVQAFSFVRDNDKLRLRVIKQVGVASSVKARYYIFSDKGL